MNVAPDSSAVRTALWRALHVQLDAPPHLIEDEISFYAPGEIVAIAQEAGFSDVRYVPTEELAERYLAGRADSLRAGSGEAMLLALT